MTSESKDPRWGQVDRDKKAEAILRTVELLAGADARVRQGKWLDIGCGSGGVAATLAQSVSHVMGVDPESWERWQQYQKDYSNLTLHRGSYRDLRKLVAPDSVDVVVCNQVYEHVDDPPALLREINAILKPGGLCYFAGPNLLWPIEPHVFWPFVHWLPRAFAQGLMRALGSRRPGELDAYSANYWRLMCWFRDAGLRCENAIRARLLAASSSSRARAVVRVVASRPVLWALTPLTPGFVFILSKPAVAEVDG